MVDKLRSKVAVAGVGYTAITRNSGRTVSHLALEACKNAIEDAGLTPKDIDGIISYHMMNDSVNSIHVALGLGISDIRWYNDFDHGGEASVSTIAEAVMAINSGVCHTVLIYRALNGRSGKRWGAYTAERGASIYGANETQFDIPYGYATPALWFALWCRRHMHEYGTTERQLGTISTAFRSNAVLNERAIFRTPLTLEEYLTGRYIAEPLRIYDCTVEVDGACAVVLTSAGRARSLRQPPVYVVGFEYSCLPGWEQRGSFCEMVGVRLGQRLQHKTGMVPKDIDFAEIYDPFSYNVLINLEDYGFCSKGEGGSFVESGAITLNGSIPVNTHGGLLSEGYLHGLNHSCEAVLQLRGVCGDRQVPNAEVGLVTSSGIVGGAIIYANKRL